MDCSNDYRNYALSVLETAFDVEDVVVGDSNDFNEKEVVELKTMRGWCEKFINAFDAYMKIKSNDKN